MGQCLRLMLDPESEVKIHVIEPTSVNGEISVALPTPTKNAEASGPTLQVPSLQRPRRESSGTG